MFSISKRSWAVLRGVSLVSRFENHSLRRSGVHPVFLISIGLRGSVLMCWGFWLSVTAGVLLAVGVVVGVEVAVAVSDGTASESKSGLGVAAASRWGSAWMRVLQWRSSLEGARGAAPREVLPVHPQQALKAAGWWEAMSRGLP